jgi:hypothetical protein
MHFVCLFLSSATLQAARTNHAGCMPVTTAAQAGELRVVFALSVIRRRHIAVDASEFNQSINPFYFRQLGP